MDTETFVHPPQVYAKQGVIWRLRKALYGMRRAPKLFFNLLHEILSELGMQSLRSEPTFYFKVLSCSSSMLMTRLCGRYG